MFPGSRHAWVLDIPHRGRRRLPLGFPVLLGLGGLLGLLTACMIIAIVLVVNLSHGQTPLDDRDVPYAGAVSRAALDAKGVANDHA